MKITKSQLRQLIKEELETVLSENSALTREGQVGDMFRQVGRDFVGKLKSAQDMRKYVDRLVRGPRPIPARYDPSRSDKFSSNAENLLGSLKAHGVDWMRPSAGGEEIADHKELRKVIEAYKEEPRAQYENFETAMLKLKNALDAYIRGEKL